MRHAADTRARAAAGPPAGRRRPAGGRRAWTAIGTAAAMAAGLAGPLVAAPAGAITASTPFPVTFTPGGTCPDVYVVPQGVTSIRVVAIGEAGTKGDDNLKLATYPRYGGKAGKASKVTTTISVTPGQHVTASAASVLFRGGAGGNVTADHGTSHGGKGGNASYVGVSDVGPDDCGGSPLASVAVVASGGGGGGGAGSLVSMLPDTTGGDGGTEATHPDGFAGFGKGATHDGRGGKGATATGPGAGGAGGEGTFFYLDAIDRALGGSLGCYPGQNGYWGVEGALVNGAALTLAGAGGDASPITNHLAAPCKGYLVGTPGSGGGGGGGYHPGGGGGGGDDSNGSGGGGGAGRSYSAGTDTTVEATDEPASVTISALETAPAFTSAATASFPVGTFSHHRVTTVGNPKVHFGNVADKPSWLSVGDLDDGTADVYGQPPVGTTGTFTVPIRIFNSVGQGATQNLVITVTGPPTITSANRTTFLAGAANTFTVRTTGVPAPTLTQNQALPGWLTFTDNHDGTGTFSGTPPTSGIPDAFTTTLTAATPGNPPNATQPFTIDVYRSLSVSSVATPMFTTQTRQLVATATHPDGSTADVTSAVTWASTAANAATVSATGLVTAVGAGATTATATLGLLNAGTSITVKNPVSLAITPANATLDPGTTRPYAATATYADGSTADLTSAAQWHTVGTGVSVTAGGLVTASNLAGTGGSIDATVRFGPNASVFATTTASVGLGTLTSIAVTPPTASINVGIYGAVSFKATGRYTSEALSDITSSTTWASSNPGVATINAAGRATAVAAGTTTITATTGAIVGSATLTVKLGDPVSLAITPSLAGLNPGSVTQLKATATYGDGSTGDVTSQVTWSSSNPAIGTITPEGVLRAMPSNSGAMSTISADLPSRSRTSLLSLTWDHPTAIELSPADQTVMAGRAGLSYTALGTFENGAQVDITSRVSWSSSNPSIANASFGGDVSTSPVGNGTVTIAATSNDGATVGTASLTTKHVDVSGPGAGTLTPSVPYTSPTFTASGGPASYSWSVTNLPYGLSMSATTGASVSFSGQVPAEQYSAGSVRRVSLTASSSSGPPASTTLTFDITIGKAPQAITFDAPVHAAPGTAVPITATSTGGSTNRLAFSIDPSSTPGTCSVPGSNSVSQTGGLSPRWTYFTTVTYAASGRCTIRVTQGADANYDAATTVTSTTAVNKGDVVIQANDAHLTYGASSAPTFTPTITGLVSPDTAAALGPVTCTTAAPPTATTHAGRYPITCSGATNTDYAVTYQPGTLTVDPAPLAVHLDDAEIAVGDGLPTFTPTYAGFVNGQSTEAFTTEPTCAPPVASSAVAGIYPVTCTGGVAPDYDLQFDAASLRIGARPIVATFLGRSTFGATPTWTMNALDTLPPGLTLDGTLTCTGLELPEAPGAPLPAGGYTVNPNLCSGVALSDPANYTLVLWPGSLAVEQTDPTLSWAAPAPITYGTPLGATQLNATATGVDGQPLAGTFSYTSPAGTILPPGTGNANTATFTPTDTNDYRSGQAVMSFLDVRKAVLRAVPDNVTIQNGQPIVITKQLLGFVNGDTAAVLSGQPVCAPTTPVTGPGTYTIACSGGVSDLYELDTTATATLTINPSAPRPASIDVLPGPPGGPVSVGVPTSFLAMINSSSGYPLTGTVVFTDNGAPLACQPGTGTLTGTTAMCTVVFTTGGPHAIGARYDGDANNPPITSTSPFFLFVDGGSTGPSASLQGTVTNSAGTKLEGITVDALNPADGSVLATATTNNKGTYSFPLAAGTEVKVRFRDTNGVYATRFNGNVASIGLAPVVTVAVGSIADVTMLVGTTPPTKPTTATLSASTSAALASQPVTFTADVRATPPASGAPASTVQFVEGGTVLATVQLSGGVATYTTKLSVGTHKLRAVFLGGTAYDPSSSSFVTVTSTTGASTTSLTSNAPTAVFRQPVTLIAQVDAVAPGTGHASAVITFKEGPTLLGTAPTDANGRASLTTSNLALGSHTIDATFGGGTVLTGSSGSTTVTVGRAATTVSLASSPSPTTFGQATTLTATVAAVAPSTGSPGATVTFADGGVTIGAAPIVGGVATLTTTALKAGSHQLTASWAGGVNYTGATSPAVTHVVAKAAATATLTPSTTSAAAGTAITFTASVVGVPPGAGSPAATVTLLDGTTPIATLALVNGTATVTTSALARGTHVLAVRFLGGQNFLPTDSPTVTITVT